MKNQYFIFLLAVLFSCKKEDGGTYTLKKVFIENNTAKNITTVFFKEQKTIDSVNVVLKPNSKELLFSISSPPGGGGLDGKLEWYPYETYKYVNIYSENNLILEYSENDCPQSKNPLCEDSYTIVKNETDKNGNKYIETKFVLED